MYQLQFKDNNVIISGVTNFDLANTLDCGQAFRWRTEDELRWTGIAYAKRLSLYKTENGDIVLENTSEEDFQNIWKDYFDLERDYGEIISNVCDNQTVKKAAEHSAGIRILNQEPWETLCSFIISQNNNIPRIKGIIERLCENFGEERDGYYTFPSAAIIATLSIDDLAVLRSGFRAKYILDAARKVNSAQVNLNTLFTIPTDDARDELMTIKGVGPKVADCVLLFSLKQIGVCPKDVWIKRALEVLFDGELPPSSLPYAGIVQQYIFNYARLTKLKI